MIQVPVELLIFIAGIIVSMLTGFFSIVIHLMIKILSSQQRLEVGQQLQAVEIANLKQERVTA